MTTMTNEQIEQKKQQLKQLKDELVEAGAWPLSEDDLDNVAGGFLMMPWISNPEAYF